MIAIARLHEDLAAAGIPLDGVSRNAQGAVRIDFAASATAAQRTQAQNIVAAFDWSAAADATGDAKRAKAAAVAAFTAGATQGGEPHERAVLALALVMLDEINAIRTAVVPALPARTLAQVRSAIAAKISATAE